MSRHNDFLETVEEVFKGALQNGVWQLSSDTAFIDENGPVDGRLLKLKTHPQPLINFGNCSYLGLETDDRLKQGAIAATLKHGTQVSSSRAYLSSGLYDQLEEKFSRMFGGHIVIAPTTTLGHLSVIPTIIGDNDVVILDQFVHASVQRAVTTERARGVKVDLLRHNRLDKLEEQIKILRQKHDKIWYMIDGVYSMYGQLAPMKELRILLEKYEQFHLYVDDAHGMGWAGKYGRGYALSQIDLHPKMILATSLAKAFGTTGGVMVFPDKKIAEKVRTVGYTLIFSGPLVPPVLGASLAAADIMLSAELPILQNELLSRIQYGNQLIVEKKLPYVELSDSPIFFICLGHPRVGYNLSKRLMKDGFYTNLAIFPAVPVKNTGLRLTFTLHTSKEDIKQLMEAIEFHLPLALAEEGKSFEDIYKAFKIDHIFGSAATAPVLLKASEFTLKVFDSIAKVDPTLWDAHFSGKGAFTWQSLKMFEETFQGNPEPENNWQIRYYQVFDTQGKLVVMTFFTLALTKDDMLASSRVSAVIEEQRKTDPYYLCSMQYGMGTPLTEGEHLFLDRAHIRWREALKTLLERAGEDRREFKAKTLVLRDFEKADTELKDFFIQEGFFPYDMPDNHILDISNWNTEEEYLGLLSRRSRKLIKGLRSKADGKIKIQLLKNSNQEQVNSLYNFYLNVKKNKLELNTFTLPYKFFENILQTEGWEVITILLSSRNLEIIAFGFCFHTGDTYAPLLVGFDYAFLEEFELYRQIVYHSILRAKEKECRHVFMGFTASFEKIRFNARAIPTVLYNDNEDNFVLNQLSLI